MSVDCQEEAPGVCQVFACFLFWTSFGFEGLQQLRLPEFRPRAGRQFRFGKFPTFSGGGLPGLGGLGNLGAPRDKSSFVRTCAGSESALETFFDSYSVFNSNIQFVIFRTQFEYSLTSLTNSTTHLIFEL